MIFSIWGQNKMLQDFLQDNYKMSTGSPVLLQDQAESLGSSLEGGMKLGKLG